MSFSIFVKRRSPRQVGQEPDEGRGKGRAFALNVNLPYAAAPFPASRATVFTTFPSSSKSPIVPLSA